MKMSVLDHEPGPQDARLATASSLLSLSLSPCPWQLPVPADNPSIPASPFPAVPPA